MYYYLQEKIIQTFFPIFVLCCEEKFHLMNFNLFYFFFSYSEVSRHHTTDYFEFFSQKIEFVNKNYFAL